MGNIICEFTELEYNNLKLFLQRVNLNANEIPAFLEIQKALIKKEGE